MRRATTYLLGVTLAGVALLATACSAGRAWRGRQDRGVVEIVDGGSE